MKTVFFDIDTQLDFLYSGGALYVPGAQSIVKRLRELTSFAQVNRIQVVSTVDAHTENDPEFKLWNPHCVIGTAGQQKAAVTLLSKRVALTIDPGAFEGIRSSMTDAAQIIVEKQHIDCFTNPNLRPLLDHLGADEYVVYGVASEVCVRYAAFGLLDLGAKVSLVADAIKAVNSEDEMETLRSFQSRGGRVIDTAQVLLSE